MIMEKWLETLPKQHVIIDDDRERSMVTDRGWSRPWSGSNFLIPTVYNKSAASDECISALIEATPRLQIINEGKK